MSQATSASIGMPENSSAAHTDSPGVCALASYAPTRRRISPFYNLRRKIVGLVAWFFLWEKVQLQRFWISLRKLIYGKQSLFDCTVQFAVQDGNQEFLRAAGGMLDTGLSKTFLSCDFVKKHLEPLGVHIKIFPNGAETIFRTIDRKDIKSIGTLRMRFRLIGDTKFVNASFYVSEYPIEGCDVLIGADIISEHWQLVRVGAPGFEPPPKPVSRKQRSLWRIAFWD
jgi:hypothetical protein